MKYLFSIISFFLLTSCNDVKVEQEFITTDPKELEKYADQALLEAQQKLDSVKKTDLLNPPPLLPDADSAKSSIVY